MPIENEWVIPKNWIGSTYSTEELITRLYLENYVLKLARKKPQLGDGATVPGPSELADDKRFSYARQYLREQVSAGESDTGRHLIVANEYPKQGRHYANGFLHRRVKRYQEAGLKLDVMAYGKRVEKDVYNYDGVSVLAGFADELVGLLACRKYDSISVHFLNVDMWLALKPFLTGDFPFIVYIHGYEVRNWSRLPHDITRANQLRARIERSFNEQDFWRKIVKQNSPITKFVFVSDWWRQAAAEDLGLRFDKPRSGVIHNIIDPDVFGYQEKTPEKRFNLLWMRSANAHNYAADVCAEILSGLRASPYWDDLQITIVGEGQYFDVFDQFSDLPNVDIRRGFVSQSEMVALFEANGIFLTPSRFDTQGVSRGEAMSAGLVPVTSPVTAIPEFVDDEVAILAEEDDITGFVRRLEVLFDKPDKFLSMSRNAAKRVRLQCGPEETTEKEIRLMRGNLSSA